MTKNIILEELEKEFKLMQKKLKFKSSLNDLDKIFFIRDYILKEDYVSKSLSRMLCARIIDTYLLWINYLHGLIIPNPNHMISITESQIFNDKEKEEIDRLINKIMAFSSSNILIGLTRNKSKEAKFIDNSIKLWNEINPKLIDIIKKVNDYWNKKAVSEKVSSIKFV